MIVEVYVGSWNPNFILYTLSTVLAPQPDTIILQLFANLII